MKKKNIYSKRNSNIIKRKKTTRKGGVRLKRENLDKDKQNDRLSKRGLLRFIKKSVFRVISDGGYSCITLECVFNQDISESSYLGLSSFNSLGTPLTNILLKLSYHAIEDANEKDFKRVIHGEKTFRHLKTSEIEREAIVQHTIYGKTLIQNNSLNPVCPAILFCQSTPLNKNMNNRLLRFILNNLQTIPDTKERDEAYIRNFIDEPMIFTAMECCKGALTMQRALEHMPDDIRKKELIGLELHAISRMHKAGYHHGDLHQQNVLLCPDLRGFYGDRGTIYIIDFGFARPLSESEEYIVKKTSRAESLKIENIHHHGANPLSLWTHGNEGLLEELRKNDRFDAHKTQELHQILGSMERNEVIRVFGYDVHAHVTKDKPDPSLWDDFWSNVADRLSSKIIIKNNFEDGDIDLFEYYKIT